MMSWVVKVVPQPPDASEKKAKEEKPAAPEKKVTFKGESKPQAPKVDKIKEDARVAEENGTQTGMLTWISQGFTLPQPGPTTKTGGANAKAKEEHAASSKPEEEGGVVSWIVQGLGKVIPQPDVKYKEEPETEEVTEVYDVAEVPDAEPLPHIPVMEVESDHEDADDTSRPFPPRVIEWIKHSIEKVVPQPEIYIHAKSDVPVKSAAAAVALKKAEAPVTHPEPKPAVDGEHVVGWIVQGIGRLLPQPASKTDSSDEVQNITILQGASDMTLEDMELDCDSKATQQPVAVQEEAPPHGEEEPRPPSQEENLDRATLSQADESVLADMEERLQQEQLEAAHVAEETARRAAEAAVRRLEEEQSDKMVVETLPEPEQTMLTKDKKPDETKVREAVEVIPPRQDTPKMFRAALKVSEEAGIHGAFAKLNAAYKPYDSAQEAPPPNPMHRRSPVPRTAPLPDADADAVSETADGTLIIRMTPRREGEEMLSVEVAPGEQKEEEAEEKEEGGEETK